MPELSYLPTLPVVPQFILVLCCAVVCVVVLQLRRAAWSRPLTPCSRWQSVQSRQQPTSTRKSRSREAAALKCCRIQWRTVYASHCTHAACEAMCLCSSDAVSVSCDRERQVKRCLLCAVLCHAVLQACACCVEGVRGAQHAAAAHGEAQPQGLPVQVRPATAAVKACGQSTG